VLAYHAVGTTPSRFVIPPDLLDDHLDFVQSKGFDLHTASEASCMKRSFGVSFDDAYADGLDDLLMLLEKQDVKATFAVVAGKLGGRNDWDRIGSLAGRRLVDAKAVRRIAKLGHEIASHSMTHRKLTDLPPDEVKRELADSKRELENLIGMPVESIVYPFGAADKGVAESARSVGYSVGFLAGKLVGATRIDNPMLLPRFEPSGVLSARGVMLTIQNRCANAFRQTIEELRPCRRAR
jgi:peptidoglycan/xylan/chitin deacetylase (PgdA/CDA1 family)